MMGQWITHNGQRIWYTDYSNFGSDAEALRQTLEACDAVVLQEPANSVRTLVRGDNTIGSVQAVQHFKDSATRTRPYVRRTAVIGEFTGIRKLLFDAIIRFAADNTQVFTDAEAAKDWLVEG